MDENKEEVVTEEKTAVPANDVVVPAAEDLGKTAVPAGDVTLEYGQFVSVSVNGKTFEGTTLVVPAKFEAAVRQIVFEAYGIGTVDE